MGFSEFKRLSKEVSSRVLGVDIDFEEQEQDGIDERDVSFIDTSADTSARASRARSDGRGSACNAPMARGGECGGSSAIAEDDPARSYERARGRWKTGVHKVVTLHRFLEAARARDRPRELARLALRQATYVVTSRLLDCPFETLTVRSSLRLPLFASSSTRKVVSDLMAAYPACALLGALEQGMGVAAKRSSQRTSSKFQVVLGIGHVICTSLVVYPVEAAFTRKVVLGQPLALTLRSLSWCSWNGASTFLVRELFEAGLSAFYKVMFPETEEEEESLLARLVYFPLQMLISIPASRVMQYVLATAPESVYPAPLSFPKAVAALYSERGPGGFFWGIGTAILVLPPIFATFMSSQMLVRSLLGQTEREKFQEQVESVRDCLELKQAGPIQITSRSHLETILDMAAGCGRPLVLCLVNDSKESRYAEIAAKAYSERLAATFLIGNTQTVPFLYNLIRDTRIPFFIPIEDACIDAKNVIFFSKDRANEAFAKLSETVGKPHEA